MSAARIAASFRVSKPEALLQRLLQVDLKHRPAVAGCLVFAHLRHVATSRLDVKGTHQIGTTDVAFGGSRE
jgi:hypothetical protein